MVRLGGVGVLEVLGPTGDCCVALDQAPVSSYGHHSWSPPAWCRVWRLAEAAAGGQHVIWRMVSGVSSVCSVLRWSLYTV